MQTGPPALTYKSDARNWFHAFVNKEMRWLMDGGKARLPFRWLQWETGKTIAFLVPSRPVDTPTARGFNSLVMVQFHTNITEPKARGSR